MMKPLLKLAGVVSFTLFVCTSKVAFGGDAWYATSESLNCLDPYSEVKYYFDMDCAMARVVYSRDNGLYEFRWERRNIYYEPQEPIISVSPIPGYSGSYPQPDAYEFNDDKIAGQGFLDDVYPTSLVFDSISHNTVPNCGFSCMSFGDWNGGLLTTGMWYPGPYLGPDPSIVGNVKVTYNYFPYDTSGSYPPDAPGSDEVTDTLRFWKDEMHSDSGPRWFSPPTSHLSSKVTVGFEWVP